MDQEKHSSKTCPDCDGTGFTIEIDPKCNCDEEFGKCTIPVYCDFCEGTGFILK
jgi:DnaJ-class molecular chaperone